MKTEHYKTGRKNEKKKVASHFARLVNNWTPRGLPHIFFYEQN